MERPWGWIWVSDEFVAVSDWDIGDAKLNVEEGEVSQNDLIGWWTKKLVTGSG